MDRCSVQGEIFGGCENHQADRADARGHQREIRQFADADSNVMTFVNHVHDTIEKYGFRGDVLIVIEKLAQDRGD